MLNYLERLMNGHIGLRILSVSVFLLVMALACWWRLLTPLQQQLREQAQQNQQRRQQVVSLQQKITAIPDPEPLPDAAPLATFSAMAAVKRVGGRLVKWQPEPRHGVLEMLLPWPQVPLLFRQLAGYSGLKIPTFLLRGDGDLVRVLLTLELADEMR